MCIMRVFKGDRHGCTCIRGKSVVCALDRIGREPRVNVMVLAEELTNWFVTSWHSVPHGGDVCVTLTSQPAHVHAFAHIKRSQHLYEASMHGVRAHGKPAAATRVGDGGAPP